MCQNQALVAAQTCKQCERVGWILNYHTVPCSISSPDRNDTIETEQSVCHVWISSGNLVSGTQYKMPHRINILIQM